eukprot:833460-Rhodomonas_salina.1
MVYGAAQDTQRMMIGTGEEVSCCAMCSTDMRGTDMRGTDMAYGAVVLSRYALRASYAVCGTDLAYGRTALSALAAMRCA